MSRLAKIPVVLGDVDVSLEGNKLTFKGKKGSLELLLTSGVKVLIDGGTIMIDAKSSASKAFLGLDRSRIANAVEGVSKGFEKKLKLEGVGYKSLLQGKNLNLSLGFSHPVIVSIPKGIEVSVDKGVVISISGVDKQLVGEFAASIRAIKPPEPYKGKGIRYEGEFVRRKAGKASK